MQQADAEVAGAHSQQIIVKEISSSVEMLGGPVMRDQ